MSKRKSLIPSKEMRMHYNAQLRIRMGNAIPNVEESKHVTSLVVRAQWDHDDADPKRILVGVKTARGNVVRFHEPLYNFPSETLVAKLGLLL